MINILVIGSDLSFVTQLLNDSRFSICEYNNRNTTLATKYIILTVEYEQDMIRPIIIKFVRIDTISADISDDYDAILLIMSSDRCNIRSIDIYNHLLHLHKSKNTIKIMSYDDIIKCSDSYFSIEYDMCYEYFSYNPLSSIVSIMRRWLNLHDNGPLLVDLNELSVIISYHVINDCMSIDELINGIIPDVLFEYKTVSYGNRSVHIINTTIGYVRLHFVQYNTVSCRSDIVVIACKRHDTDAISRDIIRDPSVPIMICVSSDDRCSTTECRYECNRDRSTFHFDLARRIGGIDYCIPIDIVPSMRILTRIIEHFTNCTAFEYLPYIF